MLNGVVLACFKDIVINATMISMIAMEARRVFIFLASNPNSRPAHGTNLSSKFPCFFMPRR